MCCCYFVYIYDITSFNSLTVMFVHMYVCITSACDQDMKVNHKDTEERIANRIQDVSNQIDEEVDDTTR